MRSSDFSRNFSCAAVCPTASRASRILFRVVAHDLDSGDRVLFGAPGYDDVPLARACCASMALPLFFSPVRIRDRHYIDGGVGRVAHMNMAETEES